MATVEELYKGLKSGTVNKSQLNEQQIGDVYKYMLDNKKVSVNQFKPEVAQRYNLIESKPVIQQQQIKPVSRFEPISPYKYQANVDLSKFKMQNNKPSTSPETELVDILSNLSMPKGNIQEIKKVDVIGNYGLGNIDLYNRPKVINNDDSISTVASMSFNEDGKEILVPMVSDEGKMLSEDEAIEQYHRTGKYLGKFNTIKEANEYAEKLHEQQEMIYASPEYSLNQSNFTIRNGGNYINIAANQQNVNDTPTLEDRIKSGFSSIGKATVGSGLSALATNVEFLSNPQAWVPSLEEIKFSLTSPRVLETDSTGKKAVGLSPKDEKELQKLKQESEQKQAVAMQKYDKNQRIAKSLGLTNATSVREDADKLLQSAARDREIGRQGLGEGGRLAYDLLTGAGQVGADIALGYTTGAGLMPIIGVRSFGQGANEARQSDADIGQQVAYGALSAGIEIATEKIVGGLPLSEKLGADGIADNTIKKMAQGIAKSPRLAKALTYIANMAGEGAEEAISEVLTPLARKLTYDPNADWATLEEVAYSALLGAGISGIMGGGVFLQGNNANNPETQSVQNDIQTELNKLYEAPNVDADSVDTMVKFLNNQKESRPEFTEFINSNLDKLNALKSQANNPIQMNENILDEQSNSKDINMAQKTFKGAIEQYSNNGEQSDIQDSSTISQENNIEGQNKSADDELFSKQVDDWVAGKFDTKNHLTVLKNTPEVYQNLGANNLPITVTSRKLERIINEYGKQRGEYHGLGIDIAKQLPEALKNPLTVLKSYNNSFVAVTNLVDNNNNPVIAALLVDGVGKIENISVSANVMTSAYGKDNFESYLQRNVEAGNVVYNSQEEKDGTRPRLQLPSADTAQKGSELPLFEDNISQNTENVKNENTTENSTTEKLQQSFDIPDIQINEVVALTEKISKRITENNKLDAESSLRLTEIIHEAHPELSAAEIESGLLDVFMDVSEQDHQEAETPQKSKPTIQQSTGEQAFKGKTDISNGVADMSRPLKRPTEIKQDISKKFNIPVSSRKFNKRKAVGFYKVLPEVIRTKFDNDLGTVTHELGHHLDKQYQFSTNHPKYITNMVEKMSPEFKKSYSESEYSGEAIAEFIRYYMTDTATAKEFAGSFYDVFQKELSQLDLTNVQETRADVLRWVNGEWQEKAQATMVSAEKQKKIWRERVKPENINMVLFDEIAPLNRFANTVKEVTGRPLSESLNPYILGMRTYKASGIVTGILEGNMSNPHYKIIYDNDNLKNIVQDVGQNMPKFELYLKTKHALTLKDQGHQIFPKDIEVSKERLEALEQQYPQFKELSDRLYKWYDAFFKSWVIDTNMLGPDSKKIYDIMREKYPYYVPMFRVREAGPNVKRAKSGFTDQRSPVDRLSDAGSDADTINPIDGLVLQVNRTVNAYTKNNVMRAIVANYKTVDGLGGFIDRVPPDMERQIVRTDALKTRIGKSLENKMTAEDIDDLINNIEDTIISFKPLSKSRDNDIVGVITKEGKKEFYQVFDENLLKALTNMDKRQLDFTVKAIAEVRRTITALTTGMNPMFSLTSNIPRDVQQAFTYGSHNNPFEYAKSTGQAVFEVVKKTDKYKNFLAYGGGYGASMQGAETKMSKELYNKLTDFRKGKKITGRSGLNHFVGMIADMNDWAEVAPRLAEFDKAYKAAMNQSKSHEDAVLYALQKSDDVTLNFMKRGTIMNTAGGQIIPYFNAGLQGINKLYRNLITDPEVRTQTWIKSITMLTMPTIILWALHRDDEDYKKLSRGIKDSYWILPWKTAAGEFIRIPKPKDLATLFGADFERGLNAIFEKEGADAFDGFLGTLLDSLTPNTETVFRPFIDVEKNEKWSGGAIVNQSLDGVLKQDQYDDTTSRIAILLAKGVSKVLPESIYASPKNVNYLLDQTGGGLMDILLPLTTPNSYTPIEAVRRKFIADPSYSNDRINEFYELKSATEKANNSYEKKGTISDRIDFIAEEELKAYYKSIDMYWDSINSIGMMTNKTLSDSQSEAFKEIMKRSRYEDSTKNKFNIDLKDKKLSDENIKLLQKTLRDEIVNLADKAIKEYKQYHDISLERFKEWAINK